ncbi:MAG: hypothetical protein ACSLFI_12745 [Solirubrobacterales bacterium]
MNWHRATPWLICGALALVVAAIAGYALGSGSAISKSEAQQARDDAYEVAYDRSLERVEAITRKSGLKSGTKRGIKAGRKTGAREGFDLGGGTAGLAQAEADADAAASAQVAAESALADRQANCGAIPEAPEICPTSTELAEYQAAVEAAAAPVEPLPEDPTDDGQ